MQMEKRDRWTESLRQNLQAGQRMSQKNEIKKIGKTGRNTRKVWQRKSKGKKVF